MAPSDRSGKSQAYVGYAQMKDVTHMIIDKLRRGDALEIPYNRRLYYQVEIHIDLDRIVLWSTFREDWYVIELLASWDWIQVQQFYRISLWQDVEVRRDKLIKRNRAFRPTHGMIYATYEPLLLFHNAHCVIEAGRFLVERKYGR